MSDSVYEKAIGTIDGVNRDFQTSVAYHPGTVTAFLDGQHIGTISDDDQGVIELGGKDVRLGFAPHDLAVLHLRYLTGPPTPGAFLGPPRPVRAVELRPSPSIGVDLSPSPARAEGQESISESVPRTASAIELVPEPVAGLDLKPKPARAEEV